MARASARVESGTKASSCASINQLSDADRVHFLVFAEGECVVIQNKQFL